MLDALPQQRFFLYDPCLLLGGPSFVAVWMGVYGKLLNVSNAYAYDFQSSASRGRLQSIVLLFLTCVNIASLFLLDHTNATTH